jgi:hypothetical protein
VSLEHTPAVLLLDCFCLAAWLLPFGGVILAILGIVTGRAQGSRAGVLLSAVGLMLAIIASLMACSSTTSYMRDFYSLHD